MALPAPKRNFINHNKTYEYSYIKINRPMFTRLLTLFFLTPILAFSQSNYKKAYFVNNNLDTIKGFINYKDVSLNPRQLSFRAGENANTKVYGINEVAYFSIEGYQDFERHFVSISQNEINLEQATGTIPASTSDTVFLAVLLKGNPISMFSYTDRLKTRYYVKEAGQQSAVELLYQSDMNKTLPIFQQQLSSLAIKYGKLSDNVNIMIQHAAYTRTAIMNIIRQVNEQSHTDFAGAKEKKQKLRMFAGAGVNYNRLTYIGKNIVTYESNTSSGPIKYRDEVSYTSYEPCFSAGFDLFTNADIQRVIIRNEFSAFFLKSNTSTI